jgi:hypothetical protein
VFITLLDKFQVIPRAAAEAHARDKGLEFLPASKASPSTFRKANQAKFKKAAKHREHMKPVTAGR